MIAILCGRLRSGGETGLWPAAMSSLGFAGDGAVLRAFANQSEPIPSPPLCGLRRSQAIAANHPDLAPGTSRRASYVEHWSSQRSSSPTANGFPMPCRRLRPGQLGD